jgi:hypothetical protein
LRRIACVAAALVAALGALGAAAGSAAARPSGFMTGFADGIFEAAPNPWLGDAVTAGARFVLLPVSWGAIAPQRPSGDPTNPANPAYSWGGLDQAVRGAVAHGLTVAFTIAGSGGAPWADGAGRPSNVTPGTWKPDPTAFGDFVKAVARRYSGSFGGLPHVRYYQPWSEPNLFNHLMPQWVRSGKHWVDESAILYRGLLNAAYTAVKSVNGSNVVVTGGTAPFGDPPGHQRVPPVRFVRDLLCLNDRLKPLSCPNPAHFDILAHHPYSAGGPWWKAFNRDDATLPDIGKLTRVLHAAERTGRALPGGKKQVWVTEFSWDSRPPDPKAIPMAMWEHWIEETFYVLWSQGVDALAWYQIRDQPCSPNCANTYQSGLYFVNGKPKPAVAAFRFPFVVEPGGRGKGIIWGLAPASGTVVVQRMSGHSWKTVARFRRGAHAIFTKTIGAQPGQLFRATDGPATSLTWRLARNHCQPSSECNVFTG